MKKLLLALGTSLLFALPAVAASNYGPVTETIGINKSLSVGLPSNHNGWTLSSNSNPSVASVNVSTSSVLIKGLASGSSSISVCAGDNTGCQQINITVSGKVLGASVAAHQSGTWVLGSDKITVYYVSQNGLIPVPTWKIFTSNGGTAKKLVDINQADEQLPLLPLMELSDSRVK